jgi:hypothetical protein
MSAALASTKVPPVEVIDTGMGIILPMVPGVDPVGVGVGVFGLGAIASLAETCMALAARIMKTSVKTKPVRKIFFCIEIPPSFDRDG